MGRRSRARGRAPMPDAPQATYPSTEGDSSLTLRGVISPKTRTQYAATLRAASADNEDAWHRAVEFLFERLVVDWVIHDVPVGGQRDLLARFRVASTDERAWIRDVLREHCAEFFPDVEAP